MSNKLTGYNQLNLSEINKEVPRDRDKKELFAKSPEIRKENPEFIFYEGQPSANGIPGIHPVRDTILRFT